MTEVLNFKLDFKINEVNSNYTMYTEEAVKKAFNEAIEDGDLYVCDHAVDNENPWFEGRDKKVAKVLDFNIDNKKMVDIDVKPLDSAITYFNDNFWGLYPSFELDSNGNPKIERVHDISIQPKVINEYKQEHLHEWMEEE